MADGMINDLRGKNYEVVARWSRPKSPDGFSLKVGY